MALSSFIYSMRRVITYSYAGGGYDETAEMMDEDFEKSE